MLLGSYELGSAELLLTNGNRLFDTRADAFDFGMVSEDLILRVNAKRAKMNLAKECYAYTGNAIKPAPTVKLGSTTLKSGTDYQVSYKNNTKKGTATVAVAGKGNYAGSLSKTFKITAK